MTKKVLPFDQTYNVQHVKEIFKTGSVFGLPMSQPKFQYIDCDSSLSFGRDPLLHRAVLLSICFLWYLNLERAKIKLFEFLTRASVKECMAEI